MTKKEKIKAKVKCFYCYKVFEQRFGSSGDDTHKKNTSHLICPICCYDNPQERIINV